MLTLTLDTNCIIALENNEPAAPAVRALVGAHKRGDVNVAVAAISASERQKNQKQIGNFSEFRQRLAVLGLETLEILPPIFYWDITFWDWCLFPDEEMQRLERRIHEVLFPGTPFLWLDFCKANGLESAAVLQNSTWRNYKCDVLALWSHIHNARGVFVTNDANFHAVTKRSALIALGAGRIERGEGAVELLQK